MNTIEYAEMAQKYIHENPENSFEEQKTTAYIRNAIRECGMEPIEIGTETGVVAYLDRDAAHTIGFRADIDAVATEEGPRHICGHDYHTATLIGVMKELSERREELKVNVLFIFQLAEELTSGAQAMVDAGLWEKVPSVPEQIFGIHNRPTVPVGKIIVHQGPLMSAKGCFEVKMIGKSGHGGEPHNCIDCLLAAAAFIQGCNTIVSRNVDPNMAAVCSILSCNCGNTENFVPEEAVMTGDIRSWDQASYASMKKRVEEMASSIAAAYSCSYEFRWYLHVPPVINGEEISRTAARAAEKTVGKENVIDVLPALGSDDFSVFGQKAPAFYFWVGSGKADGTSPAWHQADFCIEPGYLDVAIRLLVNCVL